MGEHMKYNGKKIVCVFCLFVLLGCFIGINVYGYSSKHKRVVSSTEPTLVPNIKDIVYEDYIYHDGVSKKIMVQEYNSHLGFSFRFEGVFVPRGLSDGSVVVSHKDDDRVFVKIERVTESEYYQKYEELGTVVDDNNGYLRSYKFFRGGDMTYLMISKMVNDDQGLSRSLDYIINSINFGL